MTQLFHFQDIEIIRTANAPAGRSAARLLRKLPALGRECGFAVSELSLRARFPHRGVHLLIPSSPHLTGPLPGVVKKKKIKKHRERTANPGNCNAVQLLVAER